MRYPNLIAAAAFLFLTGCAQLSPEDRKMLTESHTLAQQAAQDARIARAEVAKLSEKVDRMWQRSQHK